MKQSVKENLVIKNNLETKKAQDQVQKAEVIILSDNNAEALKTCEYCNLKKKG